MAPPEVPLRAERWNLRPWSSRRRCMMPAPNTAWLPPPWQAIATRGTCAFALFRAKAEASSSINPGGPLTRLTMVSKLSQGSFYRVGLTFRRGQLDLPHGSACSTGSACPNSRPTAGCGLNHVYFEKRSFSSSGSRWSLTQRRSAMTKGSRFRRASKSATRRVRSATLAWQ